jgi:hypothetical protein
MRSLRASLVRPMGLTASFFKRLQFLGQSWALASPASSQHAVGCLG